MSETAIPDPYAPCEAGCTHDLTTGILLSELLDRDGPFPALWAQAGSSGPFVFLPDPDRIPEPLAA